MFRRVSCSISFETKKNLPQRHYLIVSYSVVHTWCSRGWFIVLTSNSHFRYIMYWLYWPILFLFFWWRQSLWFFWKPKWYSNNNWVFDWLYYILLTNTITFWDTCSIYRRFNIRMSFFKYLNILYYKLKSISKTISMIFYHFILYG